jgi:hypothetical protein
VIKVLNAVGVIQVAKQKTVKLEKTEKKAAA